MDGQLYRSFKKIFDPIKEGLNKIIREENKTLEYTDAMRNLEDILDKMAENAQKMANLPEIEGYNTFIGLICNILGNYGSELCKQPKKITIITNIYNKDHMIKCELKGPDKIICTDFSGSKSFELPDSNSYIQGIKKKILEIFDRLYPGALTNMGKQYISIIIGASMNPNEPIKAKPEIRKHKIDKYSGNFSYNNGRYNIQMIWEFYDF